MKKKMLTVLATALVAGPMAANAVTLLTISPTSSKDSTNPEDIQCLIWGNSCPPGQQEMASYDYKQTGNESAWDITADPNTKGTDNVLPSDYTVGYLESYVGRVFDIGIDVNTTGEKGEMLRRFDVFVGGNLQFQYLPAGGYNIGAAFANGNGYFDWFLSTIDLTPFNSTDVVTFRAVWDTASDGAENFFLVRRTSQVPEPGALALLGLGLVGLGLSRRRKAG